jgi:transposase
MDVVYPCCAGLDVHKETVAVCVLWTGEKGRHQEEVRTFGTMTRDLLALSGWLASKGVTHVAMESTGVFWKPIFNILEGRFEVVLVNARHIKQVPGRKTDVKDCQWIAQLLQHGLVRGSFIPPLVLRQLRDLTRHRAQMVGEESRIANRVLKVLEDANIKLGSVASDALGVSGRAILKAIQEGEERPDVLADLARGRLRSKLPDLKAALEGRLTDHHRFLLRMLGQHLDYLEKITADLDTRIEELMRPFQAEVDLLKTIPGVKDQVAAALVAEVGVDMSQFPTELHLSAWAGMCPGNNESAGKRKSGHTAKGNRWLRRALSQAAWAASHTKNTYLSAQYRRLAGRRGKKRAIVAVGHTILVIAYHMLNRRQPYQELGGDFFDRFRPEHLKRALVRRLEKLGYEVELRPREDAA